MGLASKRVIAALKTRIEQQWLAQLCEVAKRDVALEVHWESIVTDDNHHYAADAFEQIFIVSTLEALAQVSADEVGAEALKAGLEKIVMTNVAVNHTSFRWASFDSGCLTLDHWLGNVPFGADRVKNLVDVLEAGLG
jgi:hypothetical protein